MNTLRLAISAATIAAILAMTSPAVLAEWKAAQAAGKLPESGEYQLGLFNGDAADGFMRLGWYRDGDDLVVYDRTMMPSAEVYETLHATMSANDLTPKSVVIRFHQGTAILNIDAKLGDGKISGGRTVERIAHPAERSEIDTDLPEGALLRAVTFILPLVLGTEAGQEISYDWYGPLSGQVEQVTLSSSDGGEVETPAGVYATTRWELRGGMPENDIYVTRGENPQIVRIDVLGQPLQFLKTPNPETGG